MTKPCADYADLIAASLYSEPSPKLQTHLKTCDACRTEAEELKATLQVIGQPSTELTDNQRDAFNSGLKRKLGQKSVRRPAVRTTPAWSAKWLVAASLAAVALLALLYMVLSPKPIQVEVAVRPPDPLPKINPAPKPPDPAPQVVPPLPVPKPVIPAPVPEEKPAPTPEPVPPKPEEKPEPAPTPVPAPAPVVRETVAVMAHIETIAGDVQLQAEAAKPEMGLIPGQEVHTRGKASYAVLKVSDGTRLFLSADTSLKLSSDLKAGASRSFHLAHGTVRADVAKQPAASPMIFTTATAEARVLGTELVLSAAGDATRLDVRTGKVRLTRREDTATVDVAAGHSASVPKSGPLVAKISRVTTGLQALYLFQETQGGIVHDVAGAGVPLDLKMVSAKAATWTAPGMNLTGNTRIDTEVPATRLIDACRKSQELTLEAWVQPSKPALDFQGVIVALSTDVQDRNFSLSQSAGAFESTIRSSTTDNGGRPPLSSGKATVETKLTHLVFTRTAAGQERLYVNGVEKAARVKAGTFTTWTDAHRLYIGNESFEERPWSGTYRLVAVYSQALSPADVARHFKLGVD